MKTKIFIVTVFVCIFQLSCRKTRQTENPSDLTHTKKFNSDVATAWFNLLATTTRSKPYVPPQSIRIFSYAGLALYESVVKGMPSYQSIYHHLTGDTIEADKNKEYYWPACANAALARITTNIFQTYSTPNLVPVNALEDSINALLQSVASPEKIQNSIAFGQHVADVIFEWSKSDGTFNTNGTPVVCPPYVPLGLPGKWAPTPPAFSPAAGACQGSIRTFVPGVNNSTFPALPPTYSTDPASEFYQMANEVYVLRNGVTLQDSIIVEAWRDRVGMNYNTPSHVVKLATEITSKEKLNLEEASVFFAKLTMSLFDAVVAVFYAKFHTSLSLIRPITYIRDVMGKTTWNSVYPTIIHPSYPATMPGAAAAGAEILEQTYGANYSFTDSTQKEIYGSFNFNSFADMVKDVGKSRTHSGHNFKQSVDAGIIQGRAIATKVNQLPFKKP